MEKENKIETEQKSNNVAVYIAIIVLIVACVSVVVYEIITQKNIGEVEPPNDNATISDDIIPGVNENNKYTLAIENVNTNNTVYIYGCKSENCEMIPSKKGFLIWDQNKYYYRKFKNEEYSRIYDEKDDCNIEMINMNNFIELDFLSYEAEGTEQYLGYFELIKTDEEVFLLFSSNEDRETKEFINVTDKVVDNYLAYGFAIVDLKNNKVIHDVAYCGYEKIVKEGNFYIAKERECVSSNTPDVVFSDKYLFTSENYNIYGDNIYYKDSNDNKFKVINSKNEIKIIEENIELLSLNDDKIFYLDKNKVIKLKNILEDKLVFNSNIKLSNNNLSVHYETKNDKYYLYISESDESMGVCRNNIIECYEDFIKDNNIMNSELENMKNSCINENGEYLVGYNYEFDLNGNLILGKFVCTEN